MTEPVATVRHCRRFQFSLRTLFICVAVSAVPLAWMAKERRQSSREQDIAADLKRMGYRVTLVGAFDKTGGSQTGQQPSLWRHIASGIIGQRISEIGTGMLAELFFGHERRIELNTLTQLTTLKGLSLMLDKVDDLRPLASLKNLTQLSFIEGQIEDYEPLSKLVNLEYLEIEGCRLRTLAPLASLKRLRSLALYRGNDAEPLDIAALAGLLDLESIILVNFQVDDLGPLCELSQLYDVLLEGPVPQRELESLQKALPNCAIEHDPFPRDLDGD